MLATPRLVTLRPEKSNLDARKHYNKVWGLVDLPEFCRNGRGVGA